MLERQLAQVQRLLLNTSLLERVNGQLADLMTGSSGSDSESESESEKVLLDLEDANAFVFSMDPERTWFRYHQLFGELLRLELRRTAPAEVPRLHRLAAHWFADHGEPIDAIRHLEAAGDWMDAARLLADHSFSLILDGHSETIQTLLRARLGGRTSRQTAWHASASRQRGVDLPWLVSAAKKRSRSPNATGGGTTGSSPQQ